MNRNGRFGAAWLSVVGRHRKLADLIRAAAKPASSNGGAGSRQNEVTRRAIRARPVEVSRFVILRHD